MNKILLTIATLSLMTSSAMAQTVDLTQYKDTCVDRYNKLAERNGQSDLRGLYLKYEGNEMINQSFNSMYFNPDYNIDVMMNEQSRRQGTYDLTQDGDEFTFYDHRKKRNGDRVGKKTLITKIDDDSYEVRMFKTTRRIMGKNGFEAVFDEVFDFRSNKKDGEPISYITLKRDIDKSKSLFQGNSIFSLACKKDK